MTSPKGLLWLGLLERDVFSAGWSKRTVVRSEVQFYVLLGRCRLASASCFVQRCCVRAVTGTGGPTKTNPVIVLGNIRRVAAGLLRTSLRTSFRGGGGGFTSDHEWRASR
eukprot:8684166-Pyramimonas_sp.AAC.1